MSKLAKEAAAKAKAEVPMTNAYDMQVLLSRLENAGVPVLKKAGEQSAGNVYEVTKGWMQESAKISPNPYDDVVAPFYDQMDAVVYPQIDKIDGEANQED